MKNRLFQTIVRGTTALFIAVSPAVVGAQMPDWSRFAPEDVVNRMAAAGEELESAILAFEQARDDLYRELSEMPIADPADILSAGASNPGEADDQADEPGETDEQAAEPGEADDQADDQASGSAEADQAAEDGAASEGRGPADGETEAEPEAASVPSDVADLWDRVEEGYVALGRLVTAHPPGGGTVVFAGVERYLLEIHRRLGSGIDDLLSVRDEISSYLAGLRDREEIEHYLDALSDREVEGATQTHLQFLLQETMAEWWLSLLFGLGPEDWLPALDAQRRGVADSQPELSALLGRTIATMQARRSYYETVRGLRSELAREITVDALLTDEPAVDWVSLSSVMAGLGRVGMSGAVLPFERDPSYRATIARFVRIDSFLSPTQRLAVTDRMRLVSGEAERAVAAGLVRKRIVGGGVEAAASLLSFADEAFSRGELARRSSDVHDSYLADGEAAVERLLSYLEGETSRTDEQLRWSTLAVIENRHAQTLLTGGDYPRVRDYLDGFIRNVTEDVDASIAEAMRADFVRASSGGGVEPDTSEEDRRLAEVLPASARRGRITFRVVELRDADPALPYDRTIAVRVRSEADTGSMARWIPADIVGRYYAEAFLAETRVVRGVDEEVARRWLHTHGRSAVGAVGSEAEVFDPQWFADVEALFMAAARPWLDQAVEAVDFAQETDFRARGYARILAVFDELVLPALSATRPDLELSPRVEEIFSVLRTVASGDIPTQQGEARVAALLRLTPPGSAGFSPGVLVGAVVGTVGEALRTDAQAARSIFRYARVMELSREIDLANPSEAGVALLRRVQTYGDLGWIEAVDASALRRRIVSRLTHREDTWTELE